MTADLPPRTLLLTLYGAYLRDVGGWAAVADLVSLLGDAGVSDQSTRSAISRMKQSGFLTADRRDGVAGYALTDEAAAMLQEGDDLIYGSTEHVDADWTLVVFSVPEAERSQRHRLRSRLSWLGFGQLTSGVWIGRGGAAHRVSPMLRATGLDRYVTVWSGRPLDPSSIDDWVRDAWDLDALAGAYREFIAAAGARFEEPVDDRGAFAAYLRLLSYWRRLPFMDPGLPGELLPSPWPGPEARKLFVRRRDALEHPGRRHVESTIGAAVLD